MESIEPKYFIETMFFSVGEFSEMHYALYANTTLFSVWVSYAELYNEKVYDLLDTVIVGKNTRRKASTLLQDKNGFVYIKGMNAKKLNLS